MSVLRRQLLGRAAALLPLLEDDEVTDILINGPGTVFVERAGRLIVADSPFPDAPSLSDFIERLVVPIGKRIDAAQPYLDGRLLDGSRFHVILPPIAPEGPLISIRRARAGNRASLESFGPPEIVAWLRGQLSARKNLLIAGGTGSGKTTLLCRLLDEVSTAERIAILEETRELHCLHPHAVHLEARAASPEGRGEVSLRCLVRNSLRMRPDRIVIGECRGGEAFDLLQAMNTGHRGTLGTLHANSAVDALKRLESLALLGGVGLPLRTVREWVGSCVHAVVFLERTGDVRRVSEIAAVQGLEGEVYRITPVFREGRFRP